MVAVDICNLALSYLGDSATVASIDPPEGSAQAQHCARFYPMALNLMLEMHDWNFATKRLALAEVSSSYSATWQYAYTKPSDAIRIFSVIPGALYGDRLTSYPVGYSSLCDFGWGHAWPFELDWQGSFQIETTQAGVAVVLANEYEAIARYTSSTVQPGMFTALFTDGLAWKLASMLAGPLLKGDAGAAESKRCLQMHAAITQQAIGQDANQKHGNRMPVPSSIRARN